MRNPSCLPDLPRFVNRFVLEFTTRWEESKEKKGTQKKGEEVFPLYGYNKPGSRFDLHVVIQRKLIRMRTQAQRINLIFTFVINPGFDHVFGEDIAFEQKVMVVF